MGIQVGLVGTGAFAQNFIPLFKAHPLVDRLILCDLDADKLAANAAKHEIADTCPSLEELSTSSVDACILLTQNWLHAPQAIQALKAGKHVYSAVPAGIGVEEIQQLVETVEQTGLIYMLGETSYYYPGVVYCRQRQAAGDFGQIVYSEGEYYHDWDHGLYAVARWRGGENWRASAGIPPMYYPTHSTSQIISITDAHMTHVSCQGFVDQHQDQIYADNNWNNPFSNETALFKMSDGSSARINEFRRIGHPGTVRLALFGTEASFEHNSAGAIWLTKDRDQRQPLDDQLDCVGVPVQRPGQTQEAMDQVSADDGTHLGVAAVHDVARLPRQFAGLPNGHAGSHQFLVDDFVQACAANRQPPNNVWAAARYTIPGIVAHQSAVEGGTLLEIPDCGAPH
ncbi:MAG: gfo/Idh/MocA family oxidoreductase [Candidatus Latescibacteria bacterium]|nr:gfo/Idh/MocA family oxidoreductase [Candidatus Latescibacterota bacterium]